MPDMRNEFQRLRDSLQEAATRMRQPGNGSSGGNWVIEQGREFVAAVRFLSSVPIPASERLFRTDVVDTRMIVGGAYFPLIGLLLGLIVSILPWVSAAYLHLPPLVLAVLLVVGLVLLTGGLHLDGLMDTCDGLFGGSTRERKLEIMRDSRQGSFGVLGGACVLLLKFAIFASLDVHLLPAVLLTALPTARWAMVLAVRGFPSARPQGMGATFRQSVTLQHLLVAAITSLAIALIVGHLAGLFVWIGGTITALLVGAWATQSVGGLTGDIYGAIAEVTEVVSLLILVLLYFWL